MNYSKEDKEFDQMIKGIVELSHFKSQEKKIASKRLRRSLTQQALASACESNNVGELSNEMEIVEFDHQCRYDKMLTARHQNLGKKQLRGKQN